MTRGVGLGDGEGDGLGLGLGDGEGVIDLGKRLAGQLSGALGAAPTGVQYILALMH